jgi:Lipase maturation factor
VWCIAIGQLLPQTYSWLSSGSIGDPSILFGKRLGGDFPSWYDRLRLFPSLLWVSQRDWFIRLILCIGTLSGLLVLYGGAYTRIALFVCYIVYLSMSVPFTLLFPWDSLIFEMTFYALFMPNLPVITQSFAASQPPASLIGFSLRWLLFRLMFGFGKLKFSKHSSDDAMYMKSFFVGIPMPTPIGLLANRLPDIFQYAGLFFLFLTEIPAPFLLFCSGYSRLVVGILVMGLQFAIQSCGNFGFFNVLSFVLATSALDANTSAWSTPMSAWFDGTDMWGGVGSVVVLAMFPFTLVALVFNSWCTSSWFMWPTLELQHTKLRVIPDLIRSMFPFRIIHSYGVFPPNCTPAARFSTVFQGSHDGVTWKEYQYRYFISREDSRGKFVAPYQPRFDFGMFYNSVGASIETFLTHPVLCGYAHQYTNLWVIDRVAMKLAEGHLKTTALFAYDPFHVADGGEPPRFVRPAMYVLDPTTFEEVKRTGKFWHRRFIGLHSDPFMSARTASDPHADAKKAISTCTPSPLRIVDGPTVEWTAASGPELWHPEHSVWRERSPALQRAFKLATDVLDAMSTATLTHIVTSDEVNSNSDDYQSLVNAIDIITRTRCVPDTTGPSGADNEWRVEPDQFWQEFIGQHIAPLLQSAREVKEPDTFMDAAPSNDGTTKGRARFEHVHRTVQQLQYDSVTLYAMECATGRLSKVLLHTLDRLYRLPSDSSNNSSSSSCCWGPGHTEYFFLGQLSSVYALAGKHAYIRALAASELEWRKRRPTSQQGLDVNSCDNASESQSQSQSQSQLCSVGGRMLLQDYESLTHNIVETCFNLAVFHFDMLVRESRKRRIMTRVAAIEPEPVISAFLSKVAKLSDMMADPIGSEYLPSFKRIGHHWHSTILKDCPVERPGDTIIHGDLC